MGSGRTQHVLGRSGPICLPIGSDLRQGEEKLQVYRCNRMILIAPGWPNMPCFWDLVTISSQIALCLRKTTNKSKFFSLCSKTGSYSQAPLMTIGQPLLRSWGHSPINLNLRRATTCYLGQPRSKVFVVLSCSSLNSLVTYPPTNR